MDTNGDMVCAPAHGSYASERTTIALLLLMMLPATTSSQHPIQQYLIRHFTPRDGLASVQTRGIVQDSQGFIWIGSRDAISRFDGYEFKVYPFRPRTKAYTGGLLSLHTDRDADLWVRGEYFSRFNHAADTFEHYQPNLDLARVNRICFDSNKRVIWFGSNNGLYSFDITSRKTSHYLSHEAGEDPLVNSISGIVDRGSSLLLGSRKGLWEFDKASGKFTRPETKNYKSFKLYNQEIWDLIALSGLGRNSLLAFSKGSLLYLDAHFDVVQRFDFPPGFQSLMHTLGPDGKVWFVSPHGLYYFEPKAGKLNYLEGAETPSTATNQILIDRENNIWLGSEGNGIFQLVKSQLHFRNYSLGNNSAMWSTGVIYESNGVERLVIVRHTGQISEVWDVTLNSVSLDSISIRKIHLQTPLPGTIIHSSLGNKKIWLSAFHRGVVGLSINQNSGLIETGRQQFLTSSDTARNTIRPFVSATYQENENRLWVASRGYGITEVNLQKDYGESGSVVHYRKDTSTYNSLSDDYCWDIVAKDENSLMVINWTSIDRFAQGRFFKDVKMDWNPRSILAINPDTLLVGTYNGIYEVVTMGDTIMCSATPFLKGYLIHSMVVDAMGRIWFMDPKKNIIGVYDRQRKHLLEFNTYDGLPAGRYFIIRTSGGKLVIGTSQGFTVFDPNTLKLGNYNVHPTFTQLHVNNKPPSIGRASVGTDPFFVTANIRVLQDLTLDHLHNNFRIDFSAMEFAAPEKIQYRYHLQGFDENWILTDFRNRSASYTNLDPGTYRMKLQATNQYGVWSSQERQMIIRILPPFWKTWWAYTGYVIFFVTIIFAWRRYDVSRIKLKHRAEHLSELDQLKSRFFTNISHEFRTPITLILGPLKKFYHNASKKEEKEELRMMIRNGERLHRLINQLLDLSKLEAGKMKLHATDTEIVAFLKEIASSYESMAIDKKIKYIFYPEVQELRVYIDQEKISKVVHNLLANAFKFTKSGGEIILNLKKEGGHCLISVKDSGIGIPSDQIDKVFDRFYQVDSSQTRLYEGSGLGMALAKELIDLHHGNISVSSTEGKGSIFTVTLFLGREHLAKGEITNEEYSLSERAQMSDIVIPVDSGESTTQTLTTPDKPTILIIEDNPDMRTYIRKLLLEEYQILEAANGKTGVKLAEENSPDLIISDIMMPEMDGYKVCSLVKTNELTSHIPVILLTAKADRESKLTGLETGADDYLSKPFDADELHLIVRNRIEERRKLRERFSREIMLEPKHVSVTSLDEQFLTKVLAIIEAHIDDEPFSIDELSRLAGYSNMHFYRKIKALSGQTPSLFLRMIRLKRAADLLSRNSDNVAQVAYAVGFNSLSYFNKCFKEQFGVTPGKYFGARKERH